MIPELTLLLLPIAAASGWAAARRHQIRKLRALAKRPGEDVRDYAIALTKLLKENPHGATKAIGDLADLGNDSFELHLTLGGLFRRYGQVDRAIALHQRLLNLCSGVASRRAEVTFELGLDYQRAGWYDRAESCFLELVDSESHRISALSQLLQIYQQTKDWHKAIEYTEKLQQLGKVPKGETVAHFLCELAEQARTESALPLAAEYVEQALLRDPLCVRASLMKAEMATRIGLYPAALAALRAVEDQDQAYLPEILKPLSQCLAWMEDNREVVAYLNYLHFRYALPEVTAMAARNVANVDGVAVALQFLESAVERKPTLKGLQTLLELRATCAEPEERLLLLKLERLLAQIVAQRGAYHCKQCGFTGTELHWRCPGCHYWDTVRPEGSG